jgi:IS5 family transposase
MIDEGYDQIKNYEAIRRYETETVILLNLCNEKEPHGGFISNEPSLVHGFILI